MPMLKQQIKSIKQAQILYKIFQRIEKDGILANLFDEATQF